jgi:uncharacterized hydrophobic protein (TIGR00271 family)
MRLPGFHSFVYDIRDVDQEVVLRSIKSNTLFSFSYLVLLVFSTLVCTLGLLLGITPIVIGGMIISPLMWPLMKIAIGVTCESKVYIKQAISLLLLSIVIIVLFSFLIAYLSPIKLVNQEILSRTEPTLLDIFVAFAVGVVAAFALVQKKVSDSLAGVAIAASLLPPLCVSGIGIAIYNYEISSGGFLLFLANVVSIIFVSIFVFIFSGIKKDVNNPIRLKGILLISVILIVTSLPLVSFLANYSFKAKAYTISQSVLTNYLKSISSLILVQNVKTTVQGKGGDSFVAISADVLIPEEIVLDYNQKNEIIRLLEGELNKKIDLNLRIQKTIALRSRGEKLNETFKEKLITNFREKLYAIDSTINIGSLDVYTNEDNPYWRIEAVLLGNPGTLFTENVRSEIELALQKDINQLVVLDIEFLPRLKLKSQPELENEKIKKDIENFIKTYSNDIDVLLIALQGVEDFEGKDEVEYPVSISLHIPRGYSFTDNIFHQLTIYLERKYKKNFKLKVSTLEKDVAIY